MWLLSPRRFFKVENNVCVSYKTNLGLIYLQSCSFIFQLILKISKFVYDEIKSAVFLCMALGEMGFIHFAQITMQDSVVTEEVGFLICREYRHKVSQKVA